MASARATVNPNDPFGSDSDAARHGAVIGMRLFLAALAMLFASSMLGYIILRLRVAEQAASTSVTLPVGFWFSTALILAASLVLNRAVAAVRADRLVAAGIHLKLSLALALAFVVVQTPCLISLLNSHHAGSGRGVYLYGMVFFLVLLHALHVLGGIGWLVHVIVRNTQGQYDSSHLTPVQFTALYWHFLDIVWLAMFGVMLCFG